MLVEIRELVSRRDLGFPTEACLAEELRQGYNIKMKKVANVWRDYIPNSYAECHPIFLRDHLFASINISDRLLDNGCEPDSFTYFLRRGGLELEAETSWPRRVIRRLLRIREDRAFCRFVEDKLNEEKPDLVFIHFGTTAATLLPILERMQVPVVVIFYGSDASSALRRSYWANRYRAMFPLIAKVIVLCREVAERLAALGCTREQTIVWNIPAGVEKYPYLPRKPLVPIRFMMCARFIEKKGHLVALDAMARLVAEGHDADLTLIGYGPEKKAIAERIEMLGISTRVRLIDTGARGDFAKIYFEELKRSDIFVLPSIRAKNGDDEGGPALTLVCAQAAGLPVICTRFPGAEVTVREGVTGLFCRENDPDHLRDKMSFLLNRPELWNEMGRRGAQLAREEFGEAAQVRKLADLFDHLMN